MSGISLCSSIRAAISFCSSGLAKQHEFAATVHVSFSMFAVLFLHSTLQMLTNIENRLEELFEQIEMMPPERVEMAEKVLNITAMVLGRTFNRLSSIQWFLALTCINPSSSLRAGSPGDLGWRLSLLAGYSISSACKQTFWHSSHSKSSFPGEGKRTPHAPSRGENGAAEAPSRRPSKESPGTSSSWTQEKGL